MEDIIQILFYVAIAAIAIVSRITNNKEKPATPSPEEVLEDAFPDIEIEQEKSVYTALSPEVIVQEVVVPKQTFTPVKPTPCPIITDTTSPAPQKSIRKIRINTRKEARRAFIHSEIFNRKY